MFLLPKGNPLYEHVPVTKVNLPETLEKLKATKWRLARTCSISVRSGEKDIHAFAESQRGRRHRSPTSEPKTSPAVASVEP